MCRIIKTYFLEQKDGQLWKSDVTWTEYSKPLYQLLSNTTWGELWNQTCYWSYNVSCVPIPCSIVANLKDLPGSAAV